MSLYPTNELIAEIMGTSPSARWLLDETSGNRAELSGGTALSNTTTVGSATGFAGLDNAQYDKAADFVPTDRLTQSDGTPNDLTGAFTIMFFFNCDVANSNTRMFVNKWNQDANGAAYKIFHNGTQMNFAVSPAGNASGAKTISQNSAFSTGTWYHVICTYVPSSRMEVYFNGASLMSSASSIPSSCFNSGRNLEIGGSDLDSNWSYDGKMNDLILVKDSISDAEAAAVYAYFQEAPSTFSPKVAMFSALEKVRAMRDMVRNDNGLFVPKNPGFVTA